MKRYIIGIDVGGTNIKIGLVRDSGTIISRTNLITKACIANKNKLIDTLGSAIDHLITKNKLKKSSILGIGIGMPGSINPKKGIVHYLPNIPGWHNVPLKRILEKRLKIKTFIDNDVNLITLGEWKFGAGVNFRNLICMTLGTGIGGGLILNNELYRGENFVAGEIGHMPINEEGPSCSCGGFGCFERYVGNKHLLSKASRIFKKRNITLEGIHKLALKGNAKAINFWKRNAQHIGNGLVGAINLLNPQLIVIGGGVAKSQRFLFPTIRQIISKRAMPVQAAKVKIRRAKLGNDAGIIGALVLVFDSLG